MLIGDLVMTFVCFVLLFKGRNPRRQKDYVGIYIFLRN